MTYATRTSYSSPSPPPHTRTRKMALVPRSHGRRLNVPEEIADLWLHRGVVAFFINPESTPPTSRLFYIVPRFQRLIFPHCAVAHLSPPTVPLSTSQFSLSPSLAFLHSSSLSASRAGGKRFQPRFPLPHPRPTPLYGCTVRIVIGKQISMVVLKVSALMEPSIRSTKILVPSVSLSLSPSLSFVSYV